MPAWRRRQVTLSANFAGLVVIMLGFRTRITGYENNAKAKQLGAVRAFAFGPEHPFRSLAKSSTIAASGACLVL